MKPFGIRVLIVEPGAFRTGFNTAGALGTSTPMPEYEDQMGPLCDTFTAADGEQPGDPVKAAAAIVSALADDEPPLHLPLRPDAVELISTSHETQTRETDEWSKLSNSTNMSS